MTIKSIWFTALALLAVIWGGVAFIMHETDDLVSWPDKVLQLVEEAPWLQEKTCSESVRRQHLAKVIANYQRLEIRQRRSLREDGQEALTRFFDSLTEDERKEYVNRTIEPLFEVIDRGLKIMPEEDRKRLVGRMRGDLKTLRANNPQGDKLASQDQAFMESLIAEDPMLFLREAPLKVKMELAPVLEDMQSRVQGLRR